MSKIGGWESTGFGPRLKALREAAGLSQLDLAVKAGCHKITLSKLEQGKQEPAWPLVLAICKALGVSVVAFEGAPPSDAPSPYSLTEPPVKPRGRPRKAATAPAPDQGEPPAKRGSGRPRNDG